MMPEQFFLTKGVGRHRDQLQSFELALRDAGIQYCNLVTVSSIVPAGCKLISRDQGLKMLHPGEITYVVLARNSPRNHIDCLHHQLVLQFLRRRISMVTLVSITRLGKLTKLQVTTLKILRLLCLQQLWASSLILKQLGMNVNNFSKPLV